MDVVEDLASEESDLEGLLRTLSGEAWDTPTPAAGWAVRDQVGHLAYSEELAALALLDPAGFVTQRDQLLAAIETFDSAPRRRAATADPAEILSWWVEMASLTVRALRGTDSRDRVPWVTGKMSVNSFATARLMETWAHGQDIADAVGAVRTSTNRLRHIAHLGVITRGFSYSVRGRTMPDLEVRVDLDGPGGDVWSWGTQDTDQRVRGAALDFCLLVTQRRHRDEVSLEVIGDSAAEWLSIAQAFAGPPTHAPRRSERI